MHDWGYCRVSSEEQLAGQSIDSQFRRLLDTGIPEDQILIEVGSASKGRTPELHRLFKLAREGKVSSILAIRQDRFQRNRQTAAALWELIDQHGVVFKFLDQPDIDRADPTSVLQAQILGAFSQFETEQLSQRVKNGLEQNRLMKKHHGRAPAGYLSVEGHLKPDTETWHHYKKIIDCYLKTGSSTEARRLRYDLLGKKWSQSAFARWITSPSQRGCVVFNSRSKNPELHHGQHEAIISPSEWDAIQAVRAANRQNTGAFRQRATPTLGSGLFNCSCCGSRLSFKRSSGKNESIYRCPTVRGGGCEQGYLNTIRLADVAGEIRRAIRIGASHLADQRVETEMPETDVLVELRIEREQYVGRNNPRAKRSLEEVDELIAAEVEALHIKAPERRKKVRDEFQRLSADKELKGLSDEELRAFAVRYGLQMTVDMKKVEGIQWQRLGSMFRGFSVKGDIEAIDNPMQKVINAVKINMSKS